MASDNDAEEIARWEHENSLCRGCSSSVDADHEWCVDCAPEVYE